MKIVKASNLKNEDWGGKSDPFVEYIIFNKKTKIHTLKTKEIKDNLNPEWNHEVI